MSAQRETAKPDEFQLAMNQGHSAAWDQLWERAAIYYQQALNLQPNNPQALTSLGLALIELQRHDEAIDCYQRAARISPEDPLPLEKIAQLAERMGQLDMAVQASLRGAELYLKNRDAVKAVENWERVTRLNPENLHAHSRLALVFERMGEKNKAATEFLAVASLMQSAGQPEKAMQAIQQALTVQPASAEAKQALKLMQDFKPLPKPDRPKGGTAPLRMSQVRQLEAPQSSEAPELDPIALARQKALTILAGMLFEGSDDDRENRRGLQALVTGTTGMLQRPVDRSSMVLHLSQVVDLQTRGDYNLAIDELQKAMEAGLENAAAYFDLGYLYYQSGRLESAIRQVQHAANHHDFSLASRLLLGELLQKKNMTKEASFEYLEALKLADARVVAPEKANDLIQLYDLLIESHRQQTSQAAQTRLCDNIRDLLMRPDWMEQIRRARAQIPGGERKGAPIPLAEILLEASSSKVIASVATIYDMMEHGQYRTAMEEAFIALLDAPTYLPLHDLIGEMLIKQEDIPGAVVKFQAIARSYASRGDMQQSIAYSRRVIDLNPTDIAARGRLIEQLTTFRMTDDALNEYMAMASVYYSLADLPMARKTYTEALRAAQQADVDRSVRVKILHRMADIDLQSLDLRQALRVFEQIRTLQPDDAPARSQIIQLNLRLNQEPQALAELDNYIAFMNSNNQIPELLTVMENLVVEYPDRIPVRRRMADLYRHLGRTPEAIAQLDAIGDILLDQGDRAAAIQTVEMILSMDPPNRGDYMLALEQLRKA